jgi:hypothetical protein
MGKSKSSIRVLGYSLVHLNFFLCLVMVLKYGGGGGEEWYVVTLCKDINTKRDDIFIHFFIHNIYTRVFM